jgi:hypothetical protein
MVDTVCVAWWVDDSLEAKVKVGVLQTFANSL